MPLAPFADEFKIAAAVPTDSSPATASRPTALPTTEERLLARARENLHDIQFNGTSFSGPGWELLVREGRASDFFLLGEEHGIAQVPRLARELFLALRPAGYDKLVIELSAPIADDLDHAALGGLEGIRSYYRTYPPGPAFYSWQDEAELLASVRAMIPGSERAIWGIDYEVLGDRQMIRHLRDNAPAAALRPIAQLAEASESGWRGVRERGELGGLLMFSGDPQMVRAVRTAWPSPDSRSAVILDTLQQTMEINALMRTSNWSSNERRAAFGRASMIRLLAAEQARGRGTRALVKMGANHLIRGVNWVGVHDVGALLPEVAAWRGGRTFHLLVGGGADSTHATVNPQMGVTSAPANMLKEAFGLEFLLKELPQTGLTLLDLRPLRPLATGSARLRELNNAEAVRIIHGYDAILIWNGTTATAPLPLD